MQSFKKYNTTTNGEEIFNELMQYFNDKNNSLLNFINIRSDGAVPDNVPVPNDSLQLQKVSGYS